MKTISVTIQSGRPSRIMCFDIKCRISNPLSLISPVTFLSKHTSTPNPTSSVYLTVLLTQPIQDINLRLSSLAPNIPRGTPTYPSTRYSLAPSTPTSQSPDLTLTPLLNLANHLNSCLDLIDISRWTGQSTSAPFISGQLRLLSEHLGSARACLKGHSSISPSSSDEGSGEWWSSSVPASTFEPPLNPNLSLHFTVHDASLVLTVRTLSPTGSVPHTPSSGTGTGTGSDFPSLSGFNLRDRLFGLGHSKTPTHDEVGEVFLWRGKEEVNVREKVRVESADPSLMSVAAKLSALEHEVKRWRFNLGVVMGVEEEEEEEEA